MRLFCSLTSPYARKCRALVRELTLEPHVEEVLTDPWSDASLRAVNPLGKIPALVLNDGSAIYDSPVICEYLNDVKVGKFIPRPTLFAEAKGKWRALTLQALGDGVMDATVRRYLELRRPEGQRSNEVIARQSEAIEAALATLNRASVKFPEQPTIGELASACALGYLDLRAPEDFWRVRQPQLAAWYEIFSQRPSMVATAPPTN
jgi:glutathione S-transferase